MPDSLPQRLGLIALLVYMFVLISRVLDVTSLQLRIPMMLYLVMLAMAMLSGFSRVFSLRVNWWFVLYLIWMAIAIPTSHWRAGSIAHWNNCLKIFLFFLCVQVLANNWRKLRSAIWVLALGLLLAAILSRLVGDYSTGRLKLEVGTLSDPNDFAMYMIMALCLWLLLWQTSSNPMATSLLFLIPLLLVLVSFIGTGSRGGLISLVVVFLVWLIHMPRRGRLGIIAALMILVPAAPLVMSDYVKSRFLTINSVDETDGIDMQTANMLGSSVASTESRKQLFLQSVEITVSHPVFGIGPGMFPVYTDFLAKQAGFPRGQWQPTHNLFTQISSECGIPALVLYLLAVFEVIRGLRRVRRSREQFASVEGMRQAAGYLLMAFYGLLAAGMFLSIAYTTAIYVIAALAVALTSIYDAEVVRHSATPVATLPNTAPLIRKPLLTRRFPLASARLEPRG
jgi:O-antigen ligase